ncbi:MAG: hypothetical protein ACRCX2_12340 [Paraclostridium sp.]
MRDLSKYVGRLFKRVHEIRYGWELCVDSDGQYTLKSIRGTGCGLSHIEGSGNWDFRNEDVWVTEDDYDFWKV